jgi:hypothetical protein
LFSSPASLKPQAPLVNVHLNIHDVVGGPAALASPWFTENNSR